MKNRFTILTAAFALLAFLAVPLGMRGQTRAEVVAYTLDGTIIGGTNGYATESEITQDGITWMVMGNTTINPWRIGGKNLTNENRPLYSTNVIADNVTKVVITNGTNTATVNSMTLIVSENADFSNPTSTIEGEFEASSTTTFERPENTDWSNMYYKLVYNITAGSSNQYAQFVKAEFYKESGVVTPEIQIAAEELALPYTANDNGEFNVTYTEGFEPITAWARLYNDAQATEEFDGDWIILPDEDMENVNLIPYMVEANNSTTEERTVYLYVEAAEDTESPISAVFAVTQAAAPQLFAVNFNLDGGTFVPNGVFTSDIVEVEAGTYALPSATKEGFTFDGWNDGVATYAGGANYTVSDDVDFTAQWTENTTPGPGGDEQWVLTNLADLTEDDVFVIVGNNGSNYAMANDKGTSSAPTAVAVTVANNAITSTVAANIQWNISGNATEGYTFYPNGSTTTWLYCTNTNNGVRVGTNTSKTFTLDNSGYLKHNGTSRFVGIYNSQDWRCYTSNGGNIENQTFAFYKKVTGGVLPPSITAINPDELAYNATEGSFNFTVNNPVDGGITTVAEEVEWISNAAISGNTVTFTTTVNEAGTAREGVITLTYTYNRETVTKDVTVTQAAAPVVITTIPDLFAAATSTETSVLVTFNNWVVSGVSTNGKNVFVTDNIGNGFVIFDNSGNLGNTYTAGDVLAGTAVSCHLKKYNGFAELLNVNATDLTITAGGTITVANVAMADLAGVNTGALVHYDNLTCSIDNNKYYLSDGTTTIQVYNTLYAFEALEADKEYNITGVYQQFNSTKEVLPRSAADIEEVVAPAVPSITVTPASMDLDAEQHYLANESAFTITYENIEVANYQSFAIHYYDADEEEIELGDDRWHVLGVTGSNDEGYKVSGYVLANDGEARTAYFKVSDVSNTVYSELVTINQAAYVAPPTPGEWVLTPFAELTSEDIFVITGTNANGTYAMTNNNGTGSAPAAVAVTVAGETLSGEIADTLKWNMTYDAETGYTFYPNGQTATWLYCTTGNSNNRLRVGTNTTNNVFNLDAESGYITYDTHVNDTYYYIGIYNSQDWRGYTSYGGNSNIANQTFAFYKKVVDPTAPKITVSPSTLDVSATEVDINTLSITLDNLEVASASDFTVQFYDASGEEQEMPEWILAQAAGNINYGGYTVACVTIPNPGAARTAYFRVYANDANNNVVYSNLVTVSQASDPTYAVLPFQYDDDGSAITETDGLYSIGINNLDESPKLDFFRTGSWLLLQFQEAPGTLTFDIKGVDFAGGTFKVMTSADGETYTDIATYTDTELGDEIQTMEFDNLSENVRFIKWVYTEQVDGDVALGNITLAKPYIPPFTGDTYTLATSVEPGRHYIIVGFNGDNAYAMGGQNGNNRAAVSINVVDGVAQVASEDVVEFVVNSVGFTDEVDPYSGQQSVGSGMAVYPGYWQYTIYDPADLGYLYAASSSSNYLRTETHLDADDNGVWSIEIYNETINEIEYENVAHIVAFGNNTRKLMRFNSASGVFSCYGDGNNQKDVYLYVKDEDEPQYDFYKDIAGYGSSDGGYCLVATPTTESTPNMVGMITDDGTNPDNFKYDLYSFDFTQELEWLNYRAGDFNLLNGKGYLYANQNNVTLHFQGASYTSFKSVNLQFGNTNYNWNGWNLIGNPRSDVSWVGTNNFYVMNEAGTEVELSNRSYVNPMEGIFVKATVANQSIYFADWQYYEWDEMLNIKVSGNNSNGDLARVRFGEGQGLEKFQLNPNHTKLYFSQSNKDYAVVSSANEGEMPVNFKAENNGSYTISVNAENVDMNYLHLIDNMTGADVDLLVEPNYSFEAKTTDYASRFKLVFSANNCTDENGNETFAFFNGSEWSISNIGEATLQVIDVTGRIIISETVNGNATLTTDNLSAGVYVMRLVNGNNVKTQKVIVR